MIIVVLASALLSTHIMVDSLVQFVIENSDLPEDLAEEGTDITELLILCQFAVFGYELLSLCTRIYHNCPSDHEENEHQEEEARGYGCAED